MTKSVNVLLLASVYPLCTHCVAFPLPQINVEQLRVVKRTLPYYLYSLLSAVFIIIIFTDTGLKNVP